MKHLLNQVETVMYCIFRFNFLCGCENCAHWQDTEIVKNSEREELRQRSKNCLLLEEGIFLYMHGSRLSTTPVQRANDPYQCRSGCCLLLAKESIVIGSKLIPKLWTPWSRKHDSTWASKRFLQQSNGPSRTANVQEDEGLFWVQHSRSFWAGQNNIVSIENIVQKFANAGIFVVDACTGTFDVSKIVCTFLCTVYLSDEQ